VRLPGTGADQVSGPQRGSGPGYAQQAQAGVLALGYVRRSKESDERTVSVAVQRDAIEAYAGEHAWQLVEVVTDDGVSGGRRERLKRLANRVRATGARAIVTYHLDRFARDLAGTLDYLRQFSRGGVELHVVGRGRMDVDTASGFLVTGVEGLPGRRRSPRARFASR
jgi:DNA invertase Pin-like site-specific DNA recombinase